MKPEFIDPANGDYSLNWNSHCIEAGKEDTTGLNLPEFDLDGNPRIVNPRIDMGAFEFQMPVGIIPGLPDMPQIKIFPNIANQSLTIDFPEEFENDKFKLELSSMDGKLLKELKKEPGNLSLQMNVSDLPVGVFIIRIIGNYNVIQTHKIIISR
jgi:hypothetical protein